MASTGGEFTSLRFSTEGFPPTQRDLIWYEVFGRAVSRRILSPLSDGPRRVDMTVRRLGSTGAYAGACVQRMTFTGGFTARRTREILTDGNDDVILHVHETGRRLVSQLGREAAADPAGGLLTSNADTSTIVLPQPCRFASIGLPRKLMMALVPGLEDALVRPLQPAPGILRLLIRYLDLLEDEHALKTVELQHAVATHIHDLCALVIGATPDATDIARGRGLRAARMRAIKADIARNLGDGDMSAAALARSQGVSPRYIHKLFEIEGTTLSKFVLGQRLARVHRMLSDPRHADLTVSAVAYSVGFGDLSTFNRAFRRHFGATPSDVRVATRKARANSGQATLDIGIAARGDVLQRSQTLSLPRASRK